jgi:hypothetical protein
MTKVIRDRIADLRGASRMVVDAIADMTGLVKAMRTNIAKKLTTLAGPIMGGAVNGTTSVVYTIILASRVRSAEASTLRSAPWRAR